MGAIATHFDGIPGRGDPDVLSRVPAFLGRRIGALKVQGKSFVNVGMELSQENDSSETLTQDEGVGDKRHPPPLVLGFTSATAVV